MSCVNQNSRATLEVVRDCPEPPVLAFPPNKGHDTAPQEALIARLAQLSAEALVFGATGRELLSDLAVTEGHKHNDFEGRGALVWRQLGSWRCTSDIGIPGAFNREGFVVTGPTPSEVMLFGLQLPMDDTPAPVLPRVMARAKVSIPAPGSVLDTRLAITVVFFAIVAGVPLGAPLVLAKPVALAARSVNAGLPNERIYDKEWIEGRPCDLPVADLIAGNGHLLCLVSASVSVAPEEAILWELQLALVEG